MSLRVDGVQGNPDDPKTKRVIHKLTDEEKKAGSVFTKETTVGMGENNSGEKSIFNYKDLNGDGLITEDELQSKTEEKYNTKHQKIQSNVYKDVNRDGELDLYMIDKYRYNDDGTASVSRYKDKNGDEYSDEYTKYEYDRDGNITSKKTTAEEDINSVKNRNHLEHEVENRKMERLDSGYLMFKTAIEPEKEPTVKRDLAGRQIISDGITKSNNRFVISKDNDGNTIYRVDYGNNSTKGLVDTNQDYDEEEVRDSDGNLVSYTKRSYTVDSNFYKKFEYDKVGNLVKITETTCDTSGNVISVKDLPTEEEPYLTAHVHLGTPDDGHWGDKELKETMQKAGAFIVGKR